MNSQLSQTLEEWNKAVCRSYQRRTGANNPTANIKEFGTIWQFGTDKLKNQSILFTDLQISNQIREGFGSCLLTQMLRWLNIISSVLYGNLGAQTAGLPHSSSTLSQPKHNDFIINFIINFMNINFMNINFMIFNAIDLLFFKFEFCFK